MESHLEVLPKQDMGSELFFLRKKSSPFSILVKTCLTLRASTGTTAHWLPEHSPTEGQHCAGWGGQG